MAPDIALADQIAAFAVLDEERRCRGMSLDAVASSAGVSVSGWCAWRSGDKSPAIRHLVDLADALGFEIVMRRKKTRRRMRDA